MDTYVELDTHLPDHYRTLKDNIHRFAREVMRPTAAALDRLAHPSAGIATGSPLWDFLKQAYRLGYKKGRVSHPVRRTRTERPRAAYLSRGAWMGQRRPRADTWSCRRAVRRACGHR